LVLDGQAVGKSLLLVNSVTGVAGNVTITKTGTDISVTGMQYGLAADQDVTLRYNGSNVTSISVGVGGRALFTIEVPATPLETFLRIAPSPGATARGKVSLFNWFGEVTRHERTLQP
jgi:hypothetical protein